MSSRMTLAYVPNPETVGPLSLAHLYREWGEEDVVYLQVQASWLEVTASSSGGCVTVELPEKVWEQLVAAYREATANEASLESDCDDTDTDGDDNAKSPPSSGPDTGVDIYHEEAPEAVAENGPDPAPTPTTAQNCAPQDRSRAPVVLALENDCDCDDNDFDDSTPETPDDPGGIEVVGPSVGFVKADVRSDDDAPISPKVAASYDDDDGDDDNDCDDSSTTAAEVVEDPDPVEVVDVVDDDGDDGDGDDRL